MTNCLIDNIAPALFNEGMRMAVLTESIAERDLTAGYLERYGRERAIGLRIDTYASGDEFLSSYMMHYDILFIDADPSAFDCIAVAEQVRRMDENALLFIIASSSEKAVQGYRVSAFSFMLKPFSYEAFSEEVDRARERIAKRSRSFILLPSVKGELLKADMNDMRYFESRKNKVILHCKYGVNAFYGTLKEMEEKTDPSLFVRINSCYLVNLRFVTAVEGNCAVVEGERLEISRSRRRKFLASFEEYIGTRGNDKDKAL